MRRDLLDDEIAAEDDIVESNRHVAGTMSGDVDHLERTDRHVRGFEGEIHGDGVVDRLGETVHAEQVAARFGSDAGLLQERVQPTTHHRQAHLVMRDRLNVQFVDSHARSGEFAQADEAAEVVNVSVGDEDVREVGECDGDSQRRACLFESRLQAGMTALTAGAGVYEREHAACLHEVGVGEEIRESLDGNGKHPRAARGGEGLEGGRCGHK